ncbi:MAG: TetR/AcrR family transcriptional regulator [Rikenellaceae bacterium]
MDVQQKAEIVKYARNIIVRNGVKSLKMDDVAQATHTSKRTLYETFGDKEELMFIAVKEHFDEFEINNAKTAKSAPNILIAMLIVMEEIRKNAEVNWQIRLALRNHYPKVSERLWNDKADEKRKVVALSLRAGIKQGYINNNINIDLTMNMFSYIAIGISEYNEMIDIPKDINIEDAFQEVLINYMRGISTIKGVKAIDDYIENRQKTNNKLKN